MIHRRSLEAGRKGTPRGRDSKGRVGQSRGEVRVRRRTPEGEDRVRALRHSSRRFRSGAGASPDGRVPALAEVRLVEVRTRWPGDNCARGGTCANVQVLLFSIPRLIDAPHTPVSIARPEKWTRSHRVGWKPSSTDPIRQSGLRVSVPATFTSVVHSACCRGGGSPRHPCGDGWF